MAKKSRNRVARYQKDQSGCMWGLISIFDFRNGRPQRLLSDKKRGSKRFDGAAYANITLESLAGACEVCNDINVSVQGETSAREIAKLSVKELMEEEMVVEEDKKRQESATNGEAFPDTTGDRAHVKKNRRWVKNKMSLDLDANGLVAAKDLVTEKPKHRKHKSCSSVDLNVIVEELCNRIHQKDASCLRNEQDSESAIQSAEDPFITEKKLWESTKVLLNHFNDANGCTKDSKIQPSKELTDALHILNSNKELFLKLLQDPSSQLVRHIQSSQDIQVEEGKFKVLTGSDVSKQDIRNGKQHSFFWRRFKGSDKNSSGKFDASEDVNRIVVLKPGLRSSGLSDTDTSCSSLPGSPRTKGNKNQTDRAFSLFSFADFKRKLKQAMRKDQHGLPNQPSNEQTRLSNRDKKIGAETIPMASPSRDHFLIERIPKSPGGIKKVDKAGKQIESALTPEQRVSNIYIEAKKHLAEIVGNSDIDGDNPGKRRPRSLGRILAYSGYSSPLSSPRTEGELKLSPKGESQTNNEKIASQVTQSSNFSHPSHEKPESKGEPCIPANELIQETEASYSEPQSSDGLGFPNESNIDKPGRENELPTSEVLADSVRSSDLESQKESDWMKSSSEEFLPEPVSKSEQDVCEENEPSSSSNASTLICKLTEDLDTISDATSKPSPISVLEPLFLEDDISPPGIKYSNGIEPTQVIQPRQIQFGEEISAPLEKVPGIRICVDDEKYTIEFVKDVVKMSGLTWDELLRRSHLSDHLIDPSLVDEIDFLPDLLSCDFNALFDLISEVLIEICWLHFGCMLTLAKPSIQPGFKGKDVFTEIWKEVDWYLKLEGHPRTLDQIITKDLAKARDWMDLRLDCENIGLHIQEVIFEELMEDTILCCMCAIAECDVYVLSTTETNDSVVNIEE